MALPTSYKAVADADALKPGQMKKIRVGEKRLLLARTEICHYAVDEMCSHEDYSLYLGCIEGNKIKCSLHGSYFDLRTGAALDEPAKEPIQSYPVEVLGGRVWVDAS